MEQAGEPWKGPIHNVHSIHNRSVTAEPQGRGSLCTSQCRDNWISTWEKLNQSHISHHTEKSFQVDYEPKCERLDHRAFRGIIGEYWLPESLRWLSCDQPGFLTLGPGGTEKSVPSSSSLLPLQLLSGNLLSALKRPLPVGWGGRACLACRLGGLSRAVRTPTSRNTRGCFLWIYPCFNSLKFC